MMYCCLEGQLVCPSEEVSQICEWERGFCLEHCSQVNCSKHSCGRNATFASVANGKMHVAMIG